MGAGEAQTDAGRLGLPPHRHRREAPVEPGGLRGELSEPGSCRAGGVSAPGHPPGLLPRVGDQPAAGGARLERVRPAEAPGQVWSGRGEPDARQLLVGLAPDDECRLRSAALAHGLPVDAGAVLHHRFASRLLGRGHPRGDVRPSVHVHRVQLPLRPRVQRYPGHLACVFVGGRHSVKEVSRLVCV